MPADFTGFPSQALDFYDDLEVDNSRTFWEKHKGTYEYSVKRPMVAHAGRARRRVRRREGVPPLSRRPVRQGQDAVQDRPGRVRRGRPGHRVVRRDLGARRTHRCRLLRRQRASDRPHPRGHRRRPSGQRPRPDRQEARGQRLADRRPRAQDGAPRVRPQPPPDRPAAPQVADDRPRLRRSSRSSTPPSCSRRCATTGAPCVPSWSGSPTPSDVETGARVRRCPDPPQTHETVSGAARRPRPR